VSFRLTLTDLQRLSRVCDDAKHRAASLQQLSFLCVFSRFFKGFLDLNIHNAEHRYMTHHKYKDSKLVVAALAMVHWHSSIIFVFVAGVSC